MQLLELEPLIMAKLRAAFPAVLVVSSLEQQNPKAVNAAEAVTLVYGGMTVTDTQKTRNRVSERWIVALSVRDAGAQTDQTCAARIRLTQMIGTTLEALRGAINPAITLRLVSSPPVQTSPGYQAHVMAFEAEFTI